MMMLHVNVFIIILLEVLLLLLTTTRGERHPTEPSVICISICSIRKSLPANDCGVHLNPRLQ